MYLPSNTEDLVKTLLALYDRAQEELVEKHENCLAYWLLYHSNVNENEYPLPFKVFVPWAFSTIETLMPRYMHGLLYRDPLLQVMRRHPSTDPMASASAQRLVNYWETEAEEFQKHVMVNKESLMFGESHGKNTFIRRKRKIRKIIPYVAGSPELGFEETYQSINAINRPVMIHADYFDVFYDTKPFLMSDRQWYCHEMQKSMNEIEFGDVKYKNVNGLREAGAYTKLRGLREERINAVNGIYGNISTLLPDDCRNLKEFCIRQHTNEGEIIRLITLGNDKLIMRDDILPVWPWVTCRNICLPHQALAMSELHSISGLQHNLNHLVNMQLTNMIMSITKMWMIGDAADADLDQFTLDPFGIIQVSDISQVKPVDFGPLSNSADALTGFLTNALQTTSGIQDYLQGGTPNRQEFATTVLTLQQASEARIDYGIKWKEREYLSPNARIKLELAQAYLDEPEYLENADQTWEAIDYSMIQGLMDIKMQGAAAGPKELQRAALNEYTKNVVNLLADALPMEARLELVKEISKTFDGIDGVTDVINGLLAQAYSQPPAATAGLAGQNQAASGGIPGGALAGQNIGGNGGMANTSQISATTSAQAPSKNSPAGSPESLQPLF